MSKKAERLLKFLIDYDEEHNGEVPTIGEVVKGCHTTVFTLLTKTWPELENLANQCEDYEK